MFLADGYSLRGGFSPSSDGTTHRPLLLRPYGYFLLLGGFFLFWVGACGCWVCVGFLLAYCCEGVFSGAGTAPGGAVTFLLAHKKVTKKCAGIRGHAAELSFAPEALRSDNRRESVVS